MVKNTLKSFLTFSKKELNGLLVFCSLFTGILFAPVLYRTFHKPETFSFDKFKNEIELFRSSAQIQSAAIPGRYARLKEEIESKELEPDFFEFDPNNLSSDSWKRLGLSSRQVAVIKNYENKGGRFYRREDLQKIYSITKEDYKRLEPYINIPERAPKENRSGFSAVKIFERTVRPAIIIELNTADSVQLETIRGIGPAFASRIIKYRTRLGGFYNKEQLKEVYGIDSVKYGQLEGQVSVDQSALQRININTATFDELKRHPYLSYKQMNAIIQYRKQHGLFNSTVDLKKVSVLNAETISKIEPYLLF